MPIYDYHCSACGYTFEEYHTIDERNSPCKRPCPSCKKKKVDRGFVEFPGIGYDTNLRPKAGFRELMDHMKSKVGRDYHENLERAKDARGSRYGTKSTEG